MSITDPSNFRIERIEKLLHELRYEVERGIMDGDIDETQTFQFYVPICRSIPDGVVSVKFYTRPVPRYTIHSGDLEPRLKVVK